MRRIELLRVHNLMATAVPGGYTGYYYGVPMVQPTGGTVAWEFLFATGNSRPTATDIAAIAQVAAQNPGTLWLVGNEIDHPDFGLPSGTVLPTMTPSSAPATSVRVSQDGILPAAYAQAYATIYPLIKALDPSAQVAPGSVVVWSPMRESYYKQVLDAYRVISGGTAMPIDWFNIHTYVMTEQFYWPTCHYEGLCSGSNAGFPPGYPTPNLTPTTATPTPGAWPTPTNTPMGQPTGWTQTQLTAGHVKDQIIAARKWMALNDYQDKPLIVSEYKTLAQRYAYPAATGTYPGTPPTVVQTIVPQATVEAYLLDDLLPWLLTYTDPDIGYPYDGYHLVQGWIYFEPSPDGYGGRINRDVDARWGLWYTQLPQRGNYAEFGMAWVNRMKTPTYPVMPWGCMFAAVPQSWSPGMYGYYDAGGASGSGVLGETSTPYEPYPPPGNAGQTATPTETPTPTPGDAYP